MLLSGVQKSDSDIYTYTYVCMCVCVWMGAVCAKLLHSLQLCATLWTVALQLSVHGIFQARILEWVAMPSSRETSQSRDGTWVSYIAGGFFTIEPPDKLCIYIHLYTCIHTHTHTHIVFFTCSSVDRYLGHYSAAMNIEVHVSFLIRVFFFSELYLEVGFLDHMVWYIDR